MKMDKKTFCRCRESRRSFRCSWQSLKWGKDVSLRQKPHEILIQSTFPLTKVSIKPNFIFTVKTCAKVFNQRFTSASTSSSCCFILPLFLTLCSCWGFFSFIKNKARWAAIMRPLLLLVQHLLAASGCPWGCLTGKSGQGGLTSAVSFGNRGHDSRAAVLLPACPGAGHCFRRLGPQAPLGPGSCDHTRTLWTCRVYGGTHRLLLHRVGAVVSTCSLSDLIC